MRRGALFKLTCAFPPPTGQPDSAMPELPEVETVRRGLAAALVGKTILDVDLRRGDLRFPFEPGFAETLAGRAIRAVERRAKYLLVRLEGAATLVIHLGMSGAIRLERDGEAAATARLHHDLKRIGRHDHVVLTFAGVRAIYNDPRRFGFMFVAADETLAVHPRLAGLGAEPLDPPLDGARLAALLAGTSCDLKAALLDQKRIAGLGNIYVCEALHRARLSPWRGAETLVGPERHARAAARRLAAAIGETLADALAAGGSSLRDFSSAEGKPGYFQHSFRVYDRAGLPCPRKSCNGTIARKTQSGRSTFYCPKCQT